MTSAILVQLLVGLLAQLVERWRRCNGRTYSNRVTKRLPSRLSEFKKVIDLRGNTKSNQQIVSLSAYVSLSTYDPRKSVDGVWKRHLQTYFTNP